MVDNQFTKQVISLIDELKSICADYGLGNDGNEYKIISQIFLYKFLNDKFIYDFCTENTITHDTKSFATHIDNMSDSDYEMACLGIANIRLKKQHLLHNIIWCINEPQFAKYLDDILTDIANDNSDILDTITIDGTKIQFFERICEYVTDKRDAFARAIINKISKGFDFSHMFHQGYDFYATIFEYLIKDYNSDSGGKYAEYYTPHAVARIMANILVPRDTDLKNVQCYDPSAGTGTLLMCLANQIGTNKCSIFSQDISQKSSLFLRVNLILNNATESLHNVVQGNTIKSPKYGDRKFDFIVSNPPFKLDFSDYRDDIADKYPLGVPNIPKKDKDKMAIYQLFVQHVYQCLGGRGAIVVPNGFLSSDGIDKKIRKSIIDKHCLAAIVCMPANIFATTGTKVSVVILNKNHSGDIMLIDASNMGEKEKIDGNQRTVLSAAEEQKIIDAFHNMQTTPDFSVAVNRDIIIQNDYTLTPGRYLPQKQKTDTLTIAQFKATMDDLTDKLEQSFNESDRLQTEIKKQIQFVRDAC